jgi:DNA recombination protein RmuC
MENLAVFIAVLICIVISVINFILILKLKASVPAQAQSKILEQQLEVMRKEINDEQRAGRIEASNIQQTSLSALSNILLNSQNQTTNMQDKRLTELNEQLTLRQDSLQKSVNNALFQLNEQLNKFSLQNNQNLENIRATMETRIFALQEDNNKKIEQMRATVDEKLQKTLEERLGQSFKLVSDRLEQVYKGLGEMQTLATGVGDLKKVLSNVKTRGILGEYQLGAILDQILSSEQYDSNVVTKRGTSNVVEYAIKLPGDTDGVVYLPIECKISFRLIRRLIDAYDTGNTQEIGSASAALEQRIKQCAKEIRDKYIDPPYTTDFGILFLPFEGLYAEVVRKNLIEVLQRDYKITVAGPTTMAALLNIFRWVLKH